MGMKCIGIDVGGTSVKIGLFETTGELLDKWEVKTRKENGGANILPDVAASIRGKLQERGLELKRDIAGAGLGGSRAGAAGRLRGGLRELGLAEYKSTEGAVRASGRNSREKRK